MTRFAGVIAVVVVIVSALLPGADSGEIRTWTASEGGYQARAELVSVSADGVALLRREDGVEIRVPVAKLSAADREFIAGESKPTDDTATSAPPTIKWVTAAQVESEAAASKTAKMALLIYRSYVNGRQLNSEERPLVEARLPHWVDLADKDHVRVGKNWVLKSEAEKTRQEAEDLVKHAIELLRLKSDEAAKQVLDEASRLDPDSSKPEFLMGFVYGLVANNDERAIFHFENALRREPGNVSALNNLAVSEYFTRRYAQAVSHWEEAAGRSPRNKLIAENVATVLRIQGLRITQLRLPPHLLSRLSASYRTMLNQKDMTPPDIDGKEESDRYRFWYMSPYGREWAKVDGEKGESEPTQTESVITGGGSGFVVADNYVLTNHHVVDGAENILILVPEVSGDEPFTAEVVATNPDDDLAVLRCEGLTAKPVPLADELPRRGVDVMVLGYPEMFALGHHLKSTRGSVTALPDEATQNLLLLDAVADPGNSGGPICDQRGCVVAVLSAGFLFQNNYTAGIPTTVALRFLREHIPNFKPVTPAERELSWPDVDARIAPSTVLIFRKQNSVSDAGFGDRGKSRGAGGQPGDE